MKTKLWITVFMVGLLAVLDATPTLAQQSPGSTALQGLIEEARKEGELNLMSLAGEKGSRAIASAFKRRFGLDIKINADLSGRESRKFSKARVETKSGIPPTFDLMQGNASNVFRLKLAGGAEPIENWEKLLAEISPAAYRVKDKVSPSVLASYAFLYGSRVNLLLYNPKLISERELPKTRKEMANPKYAGAFSLPPWTSNTLMGLMKYDKEELLRITRSWGQLKAHILNYRAAIERMMLGEIKFLPALPHEYFATKALDPNAPIEIAYLEDITAMSLLTHVVRKGAQHPNAAKLFALWATSPEANRLWEKYTFNPNLALAAGPVSQKILKDLKERNITPVSWFDSRENLEKFRWLKDTKEGKKYAKAIAKAQRRGK